MRAWWGETPLSSRITNNNIKPIITTTAATATTTTTICLSVAYRFVSASNSTTITTIPISTNSYLSLCDISHVSAGSSTLLERLSGRNSKGRHAGKVLFEGAPIIDPEASFPPKNKFDPGGEGG